MIQQMLTQPRQMSNGLNSGAGSTSLGAGIAGVATTFKSPSIKVYDERKKYQEWEFVYDPRKEAAKNIQNAMGAGGNNPGNSVGQSGLSSGSQSGFGSNNQSGFGQNSQSGSGQSGFGQSPQTGFGR